MRPVTVTLIAVGSALLLGTLLTVSFVKPMRSEIVPGPPDTQSRVYRNIWGQSLVMTTLREYEDQTTTPPTPMDSIESGPFRNDAREGRWNLQTKRTSDLIWNVKTTWYLHGIEVSEEEWDKR